MEDNTLIKYAVDPVLTSPDTTVYAEPSIVPAGTTTQPALDTSTPLPTTPQTTTAAVTTTEQVSISVAVVQMADYATPVNGAKITLLDSAGNAKAVSQLDPNSNTFTVWSATPGEDSVMIEAKGYQTTIYSFTDLQKEPFVYLTKAGSATPTWIALLALAAWQLARKNKKVGKINQGDVITALIALAGGYILIRGTGLIDSVLEFLHLKTSKDTQTVDQTISSPDNAFNPNYWKNYTSFPHGAFTEQQAADLAQQIYDALTWYSDDFDQAFGAIKACFSKANVSFVSWEFQKQYQLDLLGYLRHGNNLTPLDGFSDTHIAEIVNYVNSLPNN